MRALVRKEFIQMSRDNSSILIGAVLPLLLILVIGSGVSLDVNDIPVAVVMEDSSPTLRDVLSFLEGSSQFSPVYTASMRDAEALMQDREVDAILRARSDFTPNLYRGRASIQLILYGVDSGRAAVIQGYADEALAMWEERHPVDAEGSGQPGGIVIVNRMWFNEANSSRWYFIPGLIVLIMTIAGVFLTSLIMAREWERGTLEALFVSPLGPGEILAAKIVPYFCVAMTGFLLCLLASKFLYRVPLRGSLWLVVSGTVLYLLAASGMGLMISSATRNQFLASQVALLTSFLPALVLSGFIFDLRSMPGFIRGIGSVLPSTFYMDLLKTLFLAGDNRRIAAKDCAALAAYAAGFMLLALASTRKRVA
jgi:ABC-2 type transport system permease protein